MRHHICIATDGQWTESIRLKIQGKREKVRREGKNKVSLYTIRDQPEDREIQKTEMMEKQRKEIVTKQEKGKQEEKVRGGRERRKQTYRMVKKGNEKKTSQRRW